MKIKPKGGIKLSYWPWGRKTLQKFWRKMTKNCRESLPSRREKNSWKTFWKGCFWNSQRTILKNLKYDLRLIEKTGSINQTRQRLIDFLKQDFDWSKIRLDQSKFWKKQLLREKTWFFENLSLSIKYNKTNAWVWDEMLSQNTNFKPNFPKI